MGRASSSWTRAGAASVAVALWAGVAGAQDLLDPQPRHPRWGFTAALGTGGLGGDLGETLEKPVVGDFNVFKSSASGKWRYGLGVSFSSFVMKEPYDEELEWGFQQTYVFATRMLGSEASKVRPYLQLRGGFARLHPRSELFAFEPPPEEPGDSPTHPANGFSIGVIPGAEIRLNRSLALDLSGTLNYFSVSDYDLSPINAPPAGSGFVYEVRLGLRWNTDDGWPSGPPEAGWPDVKRDAWGVRKNLGWAVGETIAINWGASALNEYNRNQNFTQLNPRSMWANFEHGFTYDDNEFRTNQMIHPFNGSTYYNAGRSNGFGFWESSVFALAGAFFWECCGETHPMSFNDMIATGVGGIAFGEATYRLSSEILDNQDTGKSRFFRETGAFLVNPIRGFNRALSGAWGRQYANPSEPLDWRPEEKRSFLMAGVRMIGEGDSLSNDTKTYGLFAFDHTFGSPFDNERRKPFDSFAVTAQLSIGEKVPVTVWRLRGDLASWRLGSSGNHAFAFVQHFDYYNNTAYEFGQQAFGPSLFSRFQLSDKLGLRLRVDATAAVLAAVNSDYAFLADVGDRERFREYDYGPGLGFGAEAVLTRKGVPLLTLAYRYHWIDVLNGSVFNRDDGTGKEGSGATHTLQAPGIRFFIPVLGKIGLGGDALYFLRKSRYDLPVLADVDQRNPEVRAYVALEL